VECIEDKAFQGCGSLEKISIPNTVTKIGIGAFIGCGFKTITLPQNLTIIENVLFAGSSLVSVVIPTGVTHIGESAFADCDWLTSVYIPDSIITIDHLAFQNCSSITSIKLPNNLQCLGSGVFDGCVSLNSITIPNSVTVISEAVFEGCSSLSSIVVENGNRKYDSRDNCDAIIETETNVLITGCKNTVIPDGITVVGKHAFCQCSSLSAITIPDSVIEIADWAFLGCSSLKSIVLPANVKRIGWMSFADCSNLMSITLSEGLTHIGIHSFIGCAFLSSITLPSTIVNIEVEPFKYNQQQDKIIQIGMAGEFFIYEYLKQKYGDKVSWINDKNDSTEFIEKGLPYDIVLFDENKQIQTYIEVKTTQFTDKNFFEISYREWMFAQEKREQFHIYRLSGIGTNLHKIKIIKNPYGKWLKGEVQLRCNFY
jgi:hypothetical protein